MAIINDAKIKSLKVKLYKDGDKKGQPKQYKFTVEPGMYLLVRKNGSKLWQHQYNFKKKSGAWSKRVLSYGAYPAVSLKQAREKYFATRGLLDAGIDPKDEKDRLIEADKQRLLNEQLENDRLEKYTFEKMAAEWFSIKKSKWTENHGASIMRSLNHYAIPELGKKPIDAITRKDIMVILKDIESRPNPPLTTLRKVRQRIEAVFWYVIDTYEIIDTNPAASIKSDSFKTKSVQHHRSLNHDQIPDLMRRIDSYNGFTTTKLALKMIIHTFVRHGELRFAKWDEIDLKKRLWSIPAERMKTNKPHLVPISDQVNQMLEQLKTINGDYPFIFASNHKPHQQPISENAVLMLLKNIGMWQQTTAHGFRSTFSSLANEQQINPDAIERQLAHTPGDKVRAAYNHSHLLPQRIALMQWYSNWIDGKKENFDAFFDSFSKNEYSKLIQLQK